MIFFVINLITLFNFLEIDKKKASYTRNSTASYYRKYGPSGVYTKAAKDSLPITQYFTKQHIQKESESNKNLNEKLNEELSKEANGRRSVKKGEIQNFI